MIRSASLLGRMARSSATRRAVSQRWPSATTRAYASKLPCPSSNEGKALYIGAPVAILGAGWLLLRSKDDDEEQVDVVDIKELSQEMGDASNAAADEDESFDTAESAEASADDAEVDEAENVSPASAEDVQESKEDAVQESVESEANEPQEESSGDAQDKSDAGSAVVAVSQGDDSGAGRDDKPRHAFYKYVLVGAGTASFAALKEIIARDPDAKVLIIGDEEHEPYMRPPLTKDLWSQAGETDTANTLMYTQDGKKLSLRYHTARWYNKLENVTTWFSTSVKSMNPNAKMLVLDNKKKTVVTFDQCLLATGSRPQRPSGIRIAEEAEESISTFHTVEDYGRMEKLVRDAASIVVVGDGPLASELVCSMQMKGKGAGIALTQVTQKPGVFNEILPPYLAEYASKKIGDMGVTVVANQSVVSIDKKGDDVLLHLENGEVVKADHVVLAAESVPNVEFATGYLEADPNNGGLVVNQELQARSGIFVAGDVASYYDSALGRRRLSQYDHAYESGIVAGRNMTGDSQPYAYQPMSWSILGDMEMYSVGECLAEPSNTIAFWAKPPEMHRLEMDPEREHEYNRGVLYYLRPDNRLAGVLLWGMRPKSTELEGMRSLLYRNYHPYFHMDQLKDRITLQDWSDEEYEEALGSPVEADETKE